MRSRAPFSFWGILVSLSLSSPLLAITAEEVVAKNVEARGGAAALAALKSLRRTGRLIPARSNAPFIVSELQARPERVREEYTFQGLTQIDAFDGVRGWRVQPFEGRKEPALMSEDDVKALRIDADLEGVWVDAKAKGHALQYLGTEDVEGTLAHKVRVTLKQGGEMIVWIDPDTWMVIRDRVTLTVRGSVRQTETDYGEYEKAGGVYVPMSEESGRPGSSSVQRSRLTWEKAEANVPVASDAFAMPVPAAAGARP